MAQTLVKLSTNPYAAAVDRWSIPVRVPDVAELEVLRTSVGVQVGYDDADIYVRYREILRVMQGMSFRRILSIGCGPGIFDRLLPPDLEFLGLDVGQKEIEYASKWAARERPQFEYRRGTLRDSSLPNDHYDLVLACEVLEFMRDDELEATMAKAARVLAKGGHLLISVANGVGLHKRVARLLRRKSRSSSLREFDMVTARKLIDGLGVELRSFRAALLELPNDEVVERVLPRTSALRRAVIDRYPTLASHFVLLAQRPYA